MNLRKKILIVSLSSITLVLVIGGAFMVIQMYMSVSASKLSSLGSIANVQKDKIKDYIDHGYENASIIASQSLLKKSIISYNINKNANLKNEIRSLILDSRNSNDEFLDIFVFDSKSNLIVTANGSSVLMEDDANVLGSNILSGNQVYFVGQSSGKESSVLFLLSITDDDGKKIGAIAIKESIANILRLVTNYNGLGNTGETQLAMRGVGGNIIFLHENRFAVANIVNDFVSSRAMNIALQGQEGNYTNAIDYRNNQVVAATRFIKGVNWGLVVKQDKSEVYGTTYIAQIQIFIIVVLIWLTSFLIVRWFINLIFRRLEKLQEGMIIVKEGDLGFRFNDKRKDEISDLSKSFDEMTESLRNSRQKIDEKVNEQTADIVEKSNRLQMQQISLLNTLEDIQEEKNISMRNAQDLKKFELAVEGVSDHILITDNNGIILFANKSVERITGFKRKDIIGKKAGSKHLWGGRMSLDTYKKFWHRIKVEKKPYSGLFNNHRKNGEEYEAEIQVTPILDEHNEVIYFVNIERDVTDAHRAILTNERLANVVKYSTDGIYGLTLDGDVVDWNDGAEKIFGYSSKEMIGNSILSIVPDDIKQHTKDLFNRIKNGETLGTFDAKRIHKSGKIIDVEISNSLVKDASGNIIGSSSITRDITKEKQIDRVKTEIVSLASHQLRTPLSAVNWYSEMILDGDVGEVNSGQKEYLEQIHNSNQRMIDLVNSLLNVSKLELGTFAIKPEKINIVEASKNAIKDQMSKIVRTKQKITEEYDKELPIINADPGLTTIIFQNLLSNAIEYTKNGGKIHVSIKKKDNKSIVIKISDNGIGIPLDQQGDIFIKMFRASNARLKYTEGTGLGLYIVKSVIDQVGGSISFKSIENKGTTFIVILPISMPKQKGIKIEE